MVVATVTSALQNFIDGEYVDPAEGRTEPILNPATGEAIAEAPLSTGADVDRAVAAAKAAFDSWSTTTPGERALALLKLADAIEEHAAELAELEADNAGKPINAFRDDEIPFMVDNPHLCFDEFVQARRSYIARARQRDLVLIAGTPPVAASGLNRYNARTNLSSTAGTEVGARAFA